MRTYIIIFLFLSDVFAAKAAIKTYQLQQQVSEFRITLQLSDNGIYGISGTSSCPGCDDILYVFLSAGTYIKSADTIFLQDMVSGFKSTFLKLRDDKIVVLKSYIAFEGKFFTFSYSTRDNEFFDKMDYELAQKRRRDSIAKAVLEDRTITKNKMVSDGTYIQDGTFFYEGIFFQIELNNNNYVYRIGRDTMSLGNYEQRGKYLFFYDKTTCDTFYAVTEKKNVLRALYFPFVGKEIDFNKARKK